MREGWQRNKLVDLTSKIGSGATPKGGEKAYKSEGISLIRSLNVHDGVFKEKDLAKIDSEQADKLKNVVVKKGDVLLNITGASIARCCVVPEKYLPARVNQHVTIIRPRPELVNSEFLAYLLISKEHKDQLLFSGDKAGATRQALTKAQIENYEVDVPSLAEQKRIVAILDEAFAGIDTAIANTQKNLANARELFESYLNHRLYDVATGIATQTLACVTELIVDCEHKTAPTQETGYPSIRTPNIGKGNLILDGVKRVSEETYEQWTRRGKPIGGDLILAREAPAGNVGVIPDGEKVCLGQRTVLIRPNKSKVLSKYLAYLILHPVVQERLLSHSTGATVQHVNMRDIRALKIATLPSLEKQQEDIEVLEDAQTQLARLAEINQQKLTALNELKQSLLQQAFSGQLTGNRPDPQAAVA